MARSSSNGRPSAVSSSSSSSSGGSGGGSGDAETKMATASGANNNKKKQKKFGVFKSNLPRNLKENSRAELLSPCADEVPSPKDTSISGGVLHIPASGSSPSPTSLSPEAFLTDSSAGGKKDVSCCNGATPNTVRIVRTHRYRRWKERVLTGSVLVLLLISSSLVTYIITDHLEEVPEEVKEVCTTPECLRAASRLLDRMDRSVSPCNDFYQFACGNYLHENVVPDDSLYRSAMQEMQEDVLVIIKKMLDAPAGENETDAFGKAKRLYHSCMNTSFTVHEKDMADSPIFDLLTAEQLGVWPLLTLEWDEEEYDLERILAQLSLYQVHTLLDSYITPDERNSTMYTLQFLQKSPAVARNYYLNTSNEEYARYLAAYRVLMEETVTALSQGQPLNTSHIDDLIAFETKFAVISDSRNCGSLGGGNNSSDSLEEDEGSGRMTVAQLEELVPEIAWGRMLRYTLEQYELDLDVDSLIISLHCSGYIPDLVKLLSETPKKVIVNYLLWRFVLRYMPYISNYFQQLWQQFRSEVPDPTEERTYISRWKECAAVVNEGFGAALARMYVENHYDQKISQEIDDMVEEVRTAFHLVIDRQDWLEQEMKEVCSDKLDIMGKKIGYPEYIESTELLNAEFEGLEILEDHFLNNILRMKKHEVWKELQKLSRPVDKKRDWIIQPLVVNAFHNPTANEIILPLGILREPFYNPGYPMYLNYGSLGVVVGHELVHGFDNNGKRYDKHGNVSQWWSEDMAEQFTERAACFVEQYSQYPIQTVGKNVDGNETLGDNICDNAGVLNAWLAYTRWKERFGEEPHLPGMNYSVPQVFFITFAQIWCEVVSKEGYEKYSKDTHSPGVYRANGVAQNSRFFAETWGCPVGSPMNPEKKCHLWV
ncbi:neprilysin-1-like [Penaeus japonicus]|uniref:neprilysin-1-like n=1 Tax=Penaeus japonicus TaxID=27405 RepID=UPI001C70F7B5|nr:neprilysin-1-like [Penaeus japonicus]